MDEEYDVTAAEALDAEPDYRAHFDDLRAQAAALREAGTDIDLDTALEDRRLLCLTAPGTGLTLEDAWAALHRAEYEARAEQRGAEQARRELSRALAAGSLRPREGGGIESAALTRSDYRSLSRPEQLALKQRIREAAARGEKIFP